MSLEIDNKKIKTEDEVIKMFEIKKSTINQWYKNGLLRFQVNRKNYIYEEELNKYFVLLQKRSK